MSNQTGFMALLATSQLADLGPGPRPDVESEASLRAKIEGLSAGATLSRDQQELARALILLWHDHLDAAHTIAQGIDNPDGAFVHGIVHRREPDYGNATYWFRRTGKHGAFAELARHVEATFGSLADQTLKQQLVPHGRWDPFGFINACEKAAQRPGSDAFSVQLREVQRLEFEVLLGWLLGGSPN